MKSNYYSFLLRIWSSELEDGSLAWRVSIERSDSGEKQVFLNFIDMVNYLESFLTLKSVLKRFNED